MTPLRPDSYQEFLARKKRQDKRRREAAKRYRDKVKDEVLSGEREWSSLSRKPKSREKFERDFGSEGRVAFVHASGCIVGQDCEGPMHAHHVTSRGAGGGPEDLVSLCERHHREIHDRGRETFAREHGLLLEHEASYLSGLWAKHTEDG